MTGNWYLPTGRLYLWFIETAFFNFPFLTFLCGQVPDLLVLTSTILVQYKVAKHLQVCIDFH